MKKIVSFIMGLVAFATLNAANTANVTLTLTANGGTEASQVKLRLDPSVTEASYASWFQNLEAVGTVNIYAKVGAETYSQYKYNTLTNVPLEVVTNRREASLQHYTITFSVLVNTETLYLTDLVLDPNNENPIAIVDGETYEFDVNTTLHPNYVAGTNYVIADRFVINYQAPVTAYNVTLNDDYLATFSAAEDVEIPAGLTAWYSVDGIENDALTLLPVSGKIPANTGVVLYNANGNVKNFSLPITTGADAIATNLLKPASEWSNHSGTIYILHGHELWVYEGTEMKENKAYLQINTTSAPARIRLAFGQTTGVENVEAEAVKAEKFMENGQIFIRRGNEVFNLQGQVVK